MSATSGAIAISSVHITKELISISSLGARADSWLAKMLPSFVV